MSTLKRGDTLVVTYPNMLTDPEFDALQKNWQEQMPTSMKLLVFDGGATVQAIERPQVKTYRGWHIAGASR